jgi:hypothetical protein
MPPSLGEGASEKLFETKTLVLVFKVDFGCAPLPFGEGTSEKLKHFYWLDGFYKNNQVINKLKNNPTNSQNVISSSLYPTRFFQRTRNY